MIMRILFYDLNPPHPDQSTTCPSTPVLIHLHRHYAVKQSRDTNFGRLHEVELEGRLDSVVYEKDSCCAWSAWQVAHSADYVADELAAGVADLNEI